MKQKLSVVISAYNEEEKIEACLQSVKWVDEIVFVNNSSVDKTLEIAKKYTKSIYVQENNPLKIDLQKNLGFEKATGDYILSLDADEIVTLELRHEIENLLSLDNLKSGYFIPRQNIIFGKKIEYTGWYPDPQLRLFKKGKGQFKTDHVHEGIVVDEETGILSNHLVHHNYETVLQFIQKNMINYAQNEANNLIKNEFKLKATDLISVPSKEFISRFFARKGYRDGLHGLFLSLLMASSHLIVLAFVWEKQGFKEISQGDVLETTGKELRKSFKDINYWLVSAKIDETKNPIKKIHYRIRRKL